MSSGGEKVIELSIDETNALRLSLGLKPLNVGKPTTGGNDENGAAEAEPTGRSAREAMHAPAENMGEIKRARERVEEARLAREVSAGVGRLEEAAAGEVVPTLSALDWAARMRSASAPSAKRSVKKKKGKSATATTKATAAYTSEDIADLRVSHTVSELTAGAETVLTLADESILRRDEHGAAVTGLSSREARLENVDVSENRRAGENLRARRRIELGGGHAGGYAGYDDDEFEELGGLGQVVGPSGLAAAAGGGPGGPPNEGGDAGEGAGFRLGDAAAATLGRGDREVDAGGGLFVGKETAVSVQSAYASSGATKFASDFLTAAEEEEAGAGGAGEVGDGEAAERKRRKLERKQKKLFKKMKKRDKREKKRGRRRKGGGSDDDDESGDERPEGGGEEKVEGGARKRKRDGRSLVDVLEASAATERSGRDQHRGARGRKRGREDDDGGGGEVEVEVVADGGADGGEEKAATSREDEVEVEVEDEGAKRRREFDRVMEKGNERTRRAFSSSSVTSNKAKAYKSSSAIKGEDGADDDGEEEDEDDSFLNAALAKARRLRRLRELAGAAGSAGGGSSADKDGRDDAVARAVGAAPTPEGGAAAAAAKSGGGSGGTGGGAADSGWCGITFESDATREFSRAMRDGAAAADGAKKKKGVAAFESSKSKSSAPTETRRDERGGGGESEDGDGGDVDMVELAEQVSEDGGGDDDGGDSAAFGSGATMARPVGRGLSSVLSLLKSTGEISGRAAMEELRGRAKDERTYDDYEPLDLENVVRINPRTATDKDREFAGREVKLDYRDEHGRLLTRKEAWRQMNYQFHGYGSSVRNEERRLRQIAREKEEGARQNDVAGGRGTLGALKATQRATGKAFVVHRT